MKSFKAAMVGLGALCAATPFSAALATTTSNSFVARIVLENACDVTTTAPTELNFGTRGVLNANFDQTSTISVTCTSGAAYNIGLDAGVNESTLDDVTTRRMANGSNYVSYNIYSNSGRSAVWGNTVSTNTVAGTGSGSAQALTVYGRVPSQATPAAGTYTDTVTVTVTY